MPDSFSGLFLPLPSPPAMKSSVKWSAIGLPSIPGFCGSSLRTGSCRLSPCSLDTVQYCVHSGAEIYVSHSKKPLKSSSLLASSQALCAWEIKCLRANSQFITDLTEEKPLLVWEHPLPNGCLRASLFIAIFIYLFKIPHQLGLAFCKDASASLGWSLLHAEQHMALLQRQPWPICWTYRSDSANLQKFRGTYVNTNCIDGELFLCFPKDYT